MISWRILPLRYLKRNLLRTILSASAVALGVAMTIAASSVSRSIINSLSDSEDVRTVMIGLLDQFDLILNVVGYLITFASGFLVYNAFAMSITQRIRQLGSLRLVGMTRYQIMRLVMGEAVLIGVLGVGLGLITGPLLGRATITLIRAIIGEGFFVFTPSPPSVTNVITAITLGLLVTVISVLVPAWQATRVTPLEALRQDTASGIESESVRRTWLAISVIILMWSYLALAPPGEWVTSPMDVGFTVFFILVWLVCLALILSALIGVVGRWLRKRGPNFFGGHGRIIADNFRRGRGRVTLTILTLMVALTMVVGITGFLEFTFNALIRVKFEQSAKYGAWLISPIDIVEGMSAYSHLESLTLSDEMIGKAYDVAKGRAQVMAWNFVIVHELSTFGTSYFSFMFDPHAARQAGDWVFTFNEGDWESAMPIMEEGCGLLVIPWIASSLDAEIGETVKVTGVNGPVDCTIAGIGSAYVGASIISEAAADSFSVEAPIVLLLKPMPGVNLKNLETDLRALVDSDPAVYLSTIEGMVGMISQVIEMMPKLLTALLILAIVAAALGVINTTVMSITERRREFSLLRAVGASKRQIAGVVLGEAAMMGIIGGVLGLIAGVGTTFIMATVYGGNAWGVPEMDLWSAGWYAVRPALTNGLIGLVAAPFICAGAAWLPARGILSRSIVDALRIDH